MSRGPLAFCFGVHNHQPIGNFDSVLAETTEHAYQPFFERLRARTEVRLTVHCTGSLLQWLRAHARPTFDLLGELAAGGRIELLTGGFYEPILAILPDADKRGQIERLSAFLKTEFGVRPRGMWLAERVWEPTLPRALRDAGVEYVLVDDQHFALAGLRSRRAGRLLPHRGPGRHGGRVPHQRALAPSHPVRRSRQVDRVPRRAERPRVRP